MEPECVTTVMSKLVSDRSEQVVVQVSWAQGWGLRDEQIQFFTSVEGLAVLAPRARCARARGLLWASLHPPLLSS